LGAAIAWILLLSLQQFLSQLLSRQPEFVQLLTNGLQLSSWQTLLLAMTLFIFGSLVGVLGSLFAVRQIAVR